MPTILDIAEQVETITHELRGRVEEIDKEQKKRFEDLASKVGTLPAEEKTTIDRMQDDLNKLGDQLKELRLEAKRPTMHDHGSGLSQKKHEITQTEKTPQHEAFLAAMKSKGNLDRLSPEQRSLIEYARMDQDKLTPEQKVLYAADATTGGFFASTDFIAELKAYILLISQVRGVARVQSTAGERVQMPSLQGDASAYWAVEQASFTDSSNPTLGMISIPVYEIRGLIRISHQNLEDSMFNLEDLIKERLGLKFAQAEGKAFIKGDGNGQPRGILSYPLKASSGYTGGSAGKNNVYDAIPYVVTGVSGNITADSVIALLTDLKTAHAQNSTFAFTRGTLGTLRLLKDSMNRPLWQPFAAAGLPSTIYDRPYIELPDMDEIAANSYPILLGDFKQYMIVDRISLAMQQLNELYAAQGLVGYIARMRVGGDCLLPEAFRILKAGTA